MFYLVRVVHKFDFRLVINSTCKKKKKKPTSGKQDKIIRSEARELINHIHSLCRLKAVEKSVIFPVCRTDERMAKYCGVSVTTARKDVKQGSKGTNKETPLHTAGLEILTEM